MRLLNVETLKIKDYTLASTPPYAILSHTWEEDELTYQEMVAPTRETFMKKGYVKVTRACRQARKDRIAWVWVDTCCIDKTSSAELTEAINSMYEWYRVSDKCYVYLSDLKPHEAAQTGMGRCRWFTRGWTLQELLAPENVEFFDMSWKRRGSKTHYIQTLSECTGISSRVLTGDKPVRDCSVATRMSWASKRETTRVEDMAYCLMGLFDVSMPTVYGENRKAFRRLQEEIIKRNSDLTILAWNRMQKELGFPEIPAMDLLAMSPTGFAGNASIDPFTDDLLEFHMTNKGLFISGDFPLRVVEVTPDGKSDSKVSYELYLGSKGPQDEDVGGICLRKVGPGLFCRDSTSSLLGFGTNNTRHIRSLQARDCYIISDPTNSIKDMIAKFRQRAIHVPDDAAWTVNQVVPETLWDASDRIYLRPKLYPWEQYGTVMATEITYTVLTHSLRLVVLCDYRLSPQARIFSVDDNPRDAALIFSPKNRDNSIAWLDLEMKAPDVAHFTSFIHVMIGQRKFKISASFDSISSSYQSGTIDLFSLNLTTDEVYTLKQYSW